MYDLLYSSKDYEAEIDYIESFFSAKNTKSSVIELGCGTGKHAEILVERGYDVLGVDSSEHMISIAESRSNKYSCKVADIRDFKLHKKFDYAISMFHVVSYLIDDNDLKSMLICLNEHLNKGGIFIFDTWFSPGVLNNPPENKIKVLEDKNINITRFSEPKASKIKNVVDVNFSIFYKRKDEEKYSFLSELHSMRHFNIEEISQISSECGFELIKCEEMISRDEPNESHWSIFFILKKVK